MIRKALSLLFAILFALPVLAEQRAQQVDILLNGVRDNNDNPVASGFVYTYDAGTTNNRTTWDLYDKSDTATNPIQLDAYGRATVYADGAYKFVIKDSLGNTVQTLDNLFFGVSDASTWYCGTAGGTANALTATCSPDFNTYSNGFEVTVRASATNTTTTPTLSVDGVGAKTILHLDGTALLAGDIVSGTQYTFRYYSSSDNFLLVAGIAENAYYGQTTGSANAYVLTPATALGALKNGTRVIFEANFSNTGAATLNVSGLGAIDLNRADDTALSANDIISGTTYSAVYESSTNAWLVLTTAYSSAGAYAPTLTGVANVAASTPGTIIYVRVGNIVTGGVNFNVDPTAAGPTVTQLGISIPVASDFTTSGDAQGVCSSSVSTTERAGAIIADATNNRLEMQIATADSANHSMYCSFTYIVK